MTPNLRRKAAVEEAGVTLVVLDPGPIVTATQRRALVWEEHIERAT